MVYTQEHKKNERKHRKNYNYSVPINATESKTAWPGQLANHFEEQPSRMKHNLRLRAYLLLEELNKLSSRDVRLSVFVAILVARCFLEGKGNGEDKGKDKDEDAKARTKTKTRRHGSHYP